MDVDAQSMAKETAGMSANDNRDEIARRTAGWRRDLHAVAVVSVLLVAAGVLMAADTSPTSPTTSLSEKPIELPRPIVMRDFVVYVTKEGRFSEEIMAREALLYQSLNVAHLFRVHVNFLKPDQPEHDTLDAPEGYLYLNNVTLTPKHPFYERIGGENAITTPTFFQGGPAEKVPRAAQDIDLLGRTSRRIVYSRVDGTTVTCRRAYRSSDEGRLYGVGDCRMLGKLNLSGERVTVDDRLSSTIRVLGSPRVLGADEVGP